MKKAKPKKRPKRKKQPAPTIGPELADKFHEFFEGKWRPSNDPGVWLNWPQDAWLWLDALYAAEALRDATLLIALISPHAPPAAKPVIERLFYKAHGRGVRKPGRPRGATKPFWKRTEIEFAAQVVDHAVRDNPHLTWPQAVDDFDGGEGEFDEQSYTRNKLKEYASGKTGAARAARKRPGAPIRGHLAKQRYKKAVKALGRRGKPTDGQTLT
jgi:hypothetical protein